jgi:hypothetical protein
VPAGEGDAFRPGRRPRPAGEEAETRTPYLADCHNPMVVKESARDDLREHLAVGIALASADFDALVNGAVEYLHDDGDDPADIAAAAREIAAAELARYVARQRTWPRVTDADRFSRAFRDLDAAGIVARTDFTCCQSCGIAEIGGEVDEGAPVRGYVFCHRQDMERAVFGGGLHLSYGVFAPDAGPGSDPAVAIGQEIVRALERHGLTPSWNGEAGRRIHVPLTWERRRTGRLARWPGEPSARSTTGAPTGTGTSADGTADAAAVTDGTIAGATGPDTGGATLEVTYHEGRRGRGEDDPVAMTASEAAQVITDLEPRDGNFATFAGRSGGLVQMMWNTGPRLWLESPDLAARCSRGRHVTITEALDVVDALARQDRVDLDRLGELESVPWG